MQVNREHGPAAASMDELFAWGVRGVVKKQNDLWTSVSLWWSSSSILEKIPVASARPTAIFFLLSEAKEEKNSTQFTE